MIEYDSKKYKLIKKLIVIKRRLLMFKTRRLLCLTAISFILTACGGADSTDSTLQRSAVNKISHYAQDSSNPVPSKEDYLNAGVTNVTVVNIDELNALVAEAEAKDVDTIEELNNLTRTLMDLTPPVITLNGASTINIALGGVYNELGATAKDDKDGTIDVSVDKSTLTTSRIGTYFVKYIAIDSSDNLAIVNRTINVVEDTTPPVITITTPTSIKEGSSFIAMATALDDKDGVVPVTIIDDSKVDTSKVGIYNVIYRAVDEIGNVTTKTQSVTVTALTITDLFEKSASGELEDVTYIAVGDSTRYYEGVNDFLINERNSDAGYYSDVLSQKHIAFNHTSMAGQRVDYWLGDKNRDGNKFLISDTLSKIRDSKNPKHTIVEFSMGINDFLHDNSATKESVKANIRKSIIALQATGVKVLLVSPVPYYQYSSTSHILNDIYEELQANLNLPFVSGYDTLLDDYPANTKDILHPNENASKQLVDTIILNIENGTL